jgi:transposase-like protein
MQAILESDEDLLAEVLRLGVQSLMEAERDAYVSADPFERSGERKTQRNGYQARQLRTRVGVLDLKVPKTRDGAFYPSILERYQRSEAALVTSLAECYVQGVSTRKVSRICEELFGEGLSHETVSRYVGELDEELEPWRQRALEGEFPYLLVDARYEKARVDHRIVDVAVLVAIGVSSEGQRHVLGVDVAHGETTASWSAFLGGLKERGLTGVQLITSDAHAGLAEARRTHFPGVPWQRCQRHFLMNAARRRRPRHSRMSSIGGCAGSGMSRPPTTRPGRHSACWWPSWRADIRISLNGSTPMGRIRSRASISRSRIESASERRMGTSG